MAERADLLRRIERVEETATGARIVAASMEADLRSLDARIENIENSNRWFLRLLVSNFLGQVFIIAGAVVVFLVTRG